MKDLQRNILGMVESCLRGYHFNTTGLNVKTPYGCKNIAQDLQRISFPRKMIPVHVEFSPHIKPSIDNDIRKSLFAHYLDWPTEGRQIDRARAVLDHIDKYILVIVDGIDVLYKMNCLPALSCLSTLTHIANQHPGRMCAIVCGTSKWVPELMTKSEFALKHLVKQYPLVRHSSDLNYQKFNFIKIKN